MSEHEMDSVLDKSYLQQIIHDSHSEGTAQVLTTAFAAQTKQIMDDIGALLESEGPNIESTARGLLHRLRGSAETLGARRLSQVTRRVLDIDPAHFPSAAQTALPLLRETIEETLKEIGELLK